MAKRALRRVGAVSIGVLLPLLLLEVGLRYFARRHYFLDRSRDCFWVVRLDEGLRRSELGRARLDEDPLLGWVPRASTDRWGEGTNSRGLRGKREYALEKPPGVRRIAVVGDSFTFGLDVGDEETYCAQIEQAVPDVEVLNFGVNGYGTDQQYLRWKRDASAYDPDIVLLGFYLPDVDRNLLTVRELRKPRFVLEGDELRLIEPPPGPIREYVAGLMRDCRSTSRAFDFLAYLKRRVSDPEDEHEFQEKTRLALAILERFHADVRDRGSFFGVLVIPDPERFADPHQLALTRAVVECGARAGFAVLDLTPRLVEELRSQPDRPLYGDSEHWNAAGHALAATWIVEFLRGQGVL